MTPTPGPQTVESIVAFWICIPLIALFGLIALAALAAAIFDSEGRVGSIWATIGTGFITASFAVGYLVGMYPDDYAHHHWQRYTGTVATVATTLEKNTTTGIATFTAEPDRPFYVRDARIAAVRPGQTLTVDCVQRYSGAGGMDWPACKWVSAD